MEIITSILGIFGGGAWGWAVTAISAIVGFFLLKNEYIKYKRKKADKESKDQAQSDHASAIEQNQNANAKAKEAESESEKARKALLDKLKGKSK